MRENHEYRANRRRKKGGVAAKVKAERKALGISRSEHDRMRGEMYNLAQRAATQAKRAASQ